MDGADAARLWVAAWTLGWSEHDVNAIAARYAPDAIFSSHPFRPVLRGAEGARTYAERVFAEEVSAEFTFATPISSGHRASVEYAARIHTRDASTHRLAGVTVLTFDADGLVIEHRDYWAEQDVGPETEPLPA